MQQEKQAKDKKREVWKLHKWPNYVGKKRLNFLTKTEKKARKDSGTDRIN